MLSLAFFKHLERPVEVGALHREGEVGEAVLGDVLHDHVDIDIGLRERPEHLRRDARLVGDLEQRDLGLVPRIGDPADDILLHDLILMANECPRPRAAAWPFRSGGSKLERTSTRTPCCMASSTERVCSTLAPCEAISNISS